MTERDVQGEAAPEADVYEQRLPVTEDETEDDARDPEEPGQGSTADLPQSLPSDADPADAYEQNLAVEFDEDDYR